MSIGATSQRQAPMRDAAAGEGDAQLARREMTARTPAAKKAMARTTVSTRTHRHNRVRVKGGSLRARLRALVLCRTGSRR